MKKFVDVLENKHTFKTKGNRPVSFLLDMEFVQADNGIFCISTTTYIEKLVMKYQIYPNKNVSAPHGKDDHPEIDTFGAILRINGEC